MDSSQLPKELPVRGKKLPVVLNYQYLGVLVTTQGTFLEHVEERSRRALGVVLGRVKNVESWIGRDSFLLLKQLSVCFAPCLTWGTEVITLKRGETDALGVAFFKFLRRVFKVKFDEKDKRWEKTNKELSDIAQMTEPSELLPIARLRFFFHLFEKETTYPPECFFNGKIELENQIGKEDKRVATYTKNISSDWKKFDLLDQRAFEKIYLLTALSLVHLFLPKLQEKET